MTPAEIADFIDLATEELEAHEWGQGIRRYNYNGCDALCAVDALANVIGKTDRWGNWCAALTATQNVLKAHLPNPALALSAWNDEPGRTKQDVIDLFKNTAKDLRNQA